MIELSFADRALLPYHKPTAQRLMDAWSAALSDDILARRDEFTEACQKNAESAQLIRLTLCFLESDVKEQRIEIDVEIEQLLKQHPNAYNPIGDLAGTYDISDEDFEAAYICLWGER